MKALSGTGALNVEDEYASKRREGIEYAWADGEPRTLLIYGEILEEKRLEEINSGAMLALWVLGWWKWGDYERTPLS